MAVYILKRLLLALVVLVVIMITLVVLIQLIPGDPARIILGNHATPALIAQVRANLGLNQSVPSQVVHFLGHAVRGQLGTDFVTNEPVTSELGAPLVDTLLLSLASIVIAIVVGVPLGIVAAVRQGGVADALIRGASIVLLSMPPYVVGLLLLLVLAVENHILPALGAGSLSAPGGYLERLIMPALSLAVFWWAYLARLVRGSMLEVLGQPYVRTGRAYGLRERTLHYRVALRNALVPVTALGGLLIGYTLTGTVYAEEIFNRPGLGSLAVSAIGNRDWPVVRGVVLIYATAFILGSLLADVAYRWLDPRMRLDERAEVFV